MKIKAKLTISRWNGSGDDDPNCRNVEIRLEDSESGIRFVEAALSPRDLGLALTGMGCISCDCEVIGTDKIGKRCEVDSITFQIPNTHTDRYEMRLLALKEAKKHCPKGWSVDNYFNRQDSFRYLDGNMVSVRATIRRYVKAGGQ